MKKLKKLLEDLRTYSRKKQQMKRRRNQKGSPSPMLRNS
jgi:hypothetical protein